MQIVARRPDYPPDHVRVKKNLSQRRKVGRKRRLVKKLRRLTEPITASRRRNIVKKLVPKEKEELMDASEWYENWVPMSLGEYEESYKELQERQDRSREESPVRRKFGPRPPRPQSKPGKTDSSRREQTAGTAPPRPPAPPVLSVFMAPPGPRRPPHPPPGHQEQTSQESLEKEPQVINFSPDDIVEDFAQGFGENEDIDVIPDIQDVTNDINLVTNVLDPLISSQAEPAQKKPKREFTDGGYKSNRDTGYNSPPPPIETTDYNPPLEKDHVTPLNLDDEEIEIPSFVTTDYISPTTSSPFKPQPSSFEESGIVSDLIFHEESLNEKDLAGLNRRQAFLGKQIPILKQNTEMNQDESHSFVFE